MNKKFFLIFSILFSASFLFAQRVISPVAGNFNNKQVLVIDVSDKAECFYSLSGADPLVSGFAYDGPVLIDSVGQVNVKVTAIRDDLKEEIEINYNVQEINPFEEGSLEHSFIANTVSKGVFAYSFEEPLVIPQSFFYSLGDGRKPSLTGKTLSLDFSNRLSRYLPCTVTNGKNSWRFVIFTSGELVGTLAKFSVPFEIQDWNTFVFTGDKLIWSIDDGLWSASKLPLTLDRSVPHTISWQSVAYQKGNPVQTFVLPSEPVLKVDNPSQKAATFSIDGDLRYRMELVSSGVQGSVIGDSGLFTTATFDTFDGDCIGGEAIFAFYADGVFQGNKRSYFLIDKQPPLPPEFVSGETGFYSRGHVDLDITAESGAKIFYAVSEPLKISEQLVAQGMDYNSKEFDEWTAGNFRPYSTPFSLVGGEESPVFYKVLSYACDENDNYSAISEYRVVIDGYNYYLDSNASPVGADGSSKKPFANFEQALDVINSNRFSRFYVKGSFALPAKENLILSNCHFRASENCEFIFPPQATLLIRGASFQGENLVFKKEIKNDGSDKGAEKDLSLKSFFTLEHSTASFNNCEILALFDDSGTAFSVQNSVLELLNTGLTVHSSYYACAVSALDSKVLSKNSRFAAVSSTAVNFSVNGGLFECRNTNAKVVAQLGRIAELSKTNARLTENLYVGEFEKKIRGLTPVWADKDTLVLEDRGNNSQGF